jgi:hypothetical protein
VKAACDKAESKGAEMRSQLVEVQEEENEVDLSLLPEKDKNRILNQRTRDAKKAVDKAEREATRAVAKTLSEATAAAAKEAKKTGKSQTSPLHLTKTSIASPSEIPQAGFLYCIALSVKTTATCITIPHGLWRGGIAYSGVLLFWFPTIH